MAHPSCFQINLQGDVTGNCGTISPGVFEPCKLSDMMCGMVMCESPLNKFPLIGVSTHIVNSNMGGHVCKAAAIDLGGDVPDPGLVDDGSPCLDLTRPKGSQHGVCLQGTCVNIQTLPPVMCPSGINGQQCSGHGVCANDKTCSCHDGYEGPDCGKISSVTRVRPSGTTPLTPASSGVTRPNQGTLTTEEPKDVKGSKPWVIAVTVVISTLFLVAFLVLLVLTCTGHLRCLPCFLRFKKWIKNKVLETPGVNKFRNQHNRLATSDTDRSKEKPKTFVKLITGRESLSGICTLHSTLHVPAQRKGPVLISVLPREAPLSLPGSLTSSRQMDNASSHPTKAMSGERTASFKDGRKVQNPKLVSSTSGNAIRRASPKDDGMYFIKPKKPALVRKGTSLQWSRYGLPFTSFTSNIITNCPVFVKGVGTCRQVLIAENDGVSLNHPSFPLTKPSMFVEYNIRESGCTDDRHNSEEDRCTN